MRALARREEGQGDHFTHNDEIGRSHIGNTQHAVQGRERGDRAGTTTHELELGRSHHQAISMRQGGRREGRGTISCNDMAPRQIGPVPIALSMWQGGGGGQGTTHFLKIGRPIAHQHAARREEERGGGQGTTHA
jgi:hypothetical protein